MGHQCPVVAEEGTGLDGFGRVWTRRDADVSKNACLSGRKGKYSKCWTTVLREEEPGPRLTGTCVDLDLELVD